VTIGQRIARAARATDLADATNIGINDGGAAFQSVFHIHLHVLPRRNGDKLSVAKGMLLRRDPDREATGRILREALARSDVRQYYWADDISVLGRAGVGATEAARTRHLLSEDERLDRPSHAGDTLPA